jgi:hypothetical protein
MVFVAVDVHIFCKKHHNIKFPKPNAARLCLEVAGTSALRQRCDETNQPGCKQHLGAYRAEDVTFHIEFASAGEERAAPGPSHGCLYSPAPQQPQQTKAQQLQHQSDVYHRLLHDVWAEVDDTLSKVFGDITTHACKCVQQHKHAAPGWKDTIGISAQWQWSKKTGEPGISERGGVPCSTART